MMSAADRGLVLGEGSSRLIITLNFDDVLARLLTTSAFGRDAPEVLTIIHVHGVRSQPETTVPSDVGYWPLRDSKAVDGFW